MRKTIAHISLITIILFNMFCLSGCWNYREVENLLIISGIAIDKDQTTNNYKLTCEILKIKGGKESEIEAEIVESDGDSIFDAIRNTIKVSGQKLYWAHMQTVIISEAVAKEGILPVLDLLGRQSEPRLNLMLVISKEETAKDILTKKTTTNVITSYAISKMIESTESNTKSTISQLYKTINDLGLEGISISIPTASVIKSEDKETLEISGTSIFKKDKLIGFLSDIDVKPLLYVKDEVKGGLLYVNVESDKGTSGVTLEVTKNKTKIKPKFIDEKAVINIDIDTDVIIGEIDSEDNLLDEKGIEKIKETAQKNIENDVKNVIKKVQTEFGSDIFGFGKQVKGTMPKKWRKISEKWDSDFKDLEVNVKSKVNITGSAQTNIPIKVGD